MTELILHMNNYSITGAIIAYQTFPKIYKKNIVPLVLLVEKLRQRESWKIFIYYFWDK